MQQWDILERVENTCRRLGLSQQQISELLSSSIGTDIEGLSREVEQLRRDREELLEQQHQIMELIDAKSPERLLHDLRNVLNELNLLRALSAREEE